jgi:hypothetical protein
MPFMPFAPQQRVDAAAMSSLCARCLMPLSSPCRHAAALSPRRVLCRRYQHAENMMFERECR